MTVPVLVADFDSKRLARSTRRESRTRRPRPSKSARARTPVGLAGRIWAWRARGWRHSTLARGRRVGARRDERHAANDSRVRGDGAERGAERGGRGGAPASSPLRFRRSSRVARAGGLQAGPRARRGSPGRRMRRARRAHVRRGARLRRRDLPRRARTVQPGARRRAIPPSENGILLRPDRDTHLARSRRSPLPPRFPAFPRPSPHERRDTRRTNACACSARTSW